MLKIDKSSKFFFLPSFIATNNDDNFDSQTLMHFDTVEKVQG